MECELCKQDIDPDTAWYENICDSCANKESENCCPTCGYEYSEDDDGGVCWDCDMEMFAIFTGLI